MTIVRANIASDCDDLLIGGSISGSTITGGTSIANVGINVVDYGALWGTPRMRGAGLEVVGQPGVVLPSGLVPGARALPLTLAIRNLTAAGVASDTQLDTNMSTVLSELTDPAGTFLEWVRADGTSVWIKVINLTNASVTQIQRQRVATLNLTGLWPYWQEETENQDTVNGAAVSLSPAIGGDVKQIFNPSLEFDSDGYFEDDTTGLRVTVSGSGGTNVTVARDATTGRWRVTQSGSDAPGLASWNDKRVMLLTKGGTFTSTASVIVKWRNQYA